MRMRNWRPLAALVVLCGLVAAQAIGGALDIRRSLIFVGPTTPVQAVDTLEQSTKWFEVTGANRVLIRTWSTHGGAYLTSDSVYSDSLATFKVLLSDSVSFMGRDSAGVLVTARSGIPKTSAHGEPYPVCADSVSINALPDAVTPDTTFKMVSAAYPPINVILKPSVNGSGVYTLIAAALPPAGTSIYGDGSITARYMKIRFQSRQRVTPSGAVSTSPNRTRGIPGLRMEAQVIVPNK